MFFSAMTAHSQESKTTALNYGNTARPLRVNQWLKGKPVERFEKGKCCVVDFGQHGASLVKP